MIILNDNLNYYRPSESVIICLLTVSLSSVLTVSSLSALSARRGYFLEKRNRPLMRARAHVELSRTGLVKCVYNNYVWKSVLTLALDYVKLGLDGTKKFLKLINVWTSSLQNAPLGPT